MSDTEIRNYREVGSEQGKRPSMLSTARRLAGKVVLVTGADSQIGHNTALAFAREGADIALVYQTNQRGEAVTAPNAMRRQIERHGSRCIILSGNPADAQSRSQILQQTLDTFGCIDVLANHVTVHCTPVWLLAGNNERLAHAFHSGFSALFQMSRAALTHVKDADAVINTLSVALRQDTADTGDRLALTRSFASALSAPGMPRSAMPLNAIDMSEVCRDELPQRPLDMPCDEVVFSYLFVLSEDASDMTGRIWHVGL